MNRKEEIENRLKEIDSLLNEDKEIQLEGIEIPMVTLKKKFYKNIIGNDYRMKEEVMDAIAGVYEKYGINIT